MYRKPRPLSAELEALHEMRDELNIQLSLALDNELPCEQHLTNLRHSLSEVESQIRLHSQR